MLYDWVCLSWFDTLSVGGTLFTIVLVQFLNATFNLTEKITTTDDITKDINGQLKQQKSEFNENLISTPIPSTPIPGVSEIPTTLTRHSQNFANNGSQNRLSSNASLSSAETLLSDEYHEDEDTLSLDNLFPCDQSEIYASKKISFIIDELIQTETSYVNYLRKGLENYGELQKVPDLPEALEGVEKQADLLGNIGEILALHEKQILPLMLRNRRDLKALFDEFSTHFDKDNFYVYVIFMMNKKTSMQLRQEQREWFQNYQNQIKDKLGVDSFLVQPIQRLTRYPLLLQTFIKEFYKNGINCKPVLASVCKLETRMRRMLDVVNQAEELPSIEDINELHIHKQGRFRRSTEFDLFNYRTKKKYRAKIFLFERCLASVEVRKKRLVYRQHLAWENIELKLSNSKSITVLQRPAGSTPTIVGDKVDGEQAANAALPVEIPVGREELELSSPEAISITHWMRAARRITEVARVEASQRARFSLPMDLVLGVAFAIWLIWRYLH